MRKLLTMLSLLLVCSVAFGQGIGTVKLMNWEAKEAKKIQQQQKSLTVAIQKASVKALKKKKAETKKAQTTKKSAQGTQATQPNQPTQSTQSAQSKNQHLPYYYWGREGKAMLAGDMMFKKIETKKQKKEKQKKQPAKKK